MKKYLILDMGNVLVYSATGSWLITPTFLENIDKEKINVKRLKELVKNGSSILDEKAETLEEEYIIIKKFYQELFKKIDYDISKENLENIVKDFVYNENDNKYFLYEDVREELKRLSNKYTILMLSDNWPCGIEFLKKYDIFKYFTKVYISSSYGIKKCEKVLFDYPIKEFNIKNNEAFFIDDKEDLLDIAVEKGLDVILMDREKCVNNSKYRVINSLKEL